MGTPTPLIAIVGRPNVGKSRLFNRMTGSRDAIVEDYVGVTRDRNYGSGTWDGRGYDVVDTGGFEPDSDDVILKQMREQAQLAIEEADVILFVMDGRAGLTTADEEIARMLRQSNKLVFPVINKIDGPRHDDLIHEFYRTGFDRLYGISAEHGYNYDELLDSVQDFLPKATRKEDDGSMKVCVIGKPNAGKSSLINRILGEQRLLTSDIPGTTRDSIDLKVQVNKNSYLFIDTAGIRRKKSISLLVEKYSVVKALKAIDRADVALYVIDAEHGLTEQDKKLLGIALGKGRPFILLVNKWDLVEKDTNTAAKWVKSLRHEMPDINYAPVMFISALTGQRVFKVFEEIHKVHEQCQRRLTTGPLNRWFQKVQRQHSPPNHRGRKAKLFYMSQVATSPPTFMIAVNDTDAIKPSYKRFLLNQLRAEFEFYGTPVKLFFRQRSSDDEQ